ncbi:MAG: SDR family oxidoreductase [Magnetococcales bacterium]|nr:SDR family oxidoreductase [Magnetococcales bacterium]
MERIFIFGATSAMAHATARFYAAEGATFFLVARQAEKLQTVTNDLLAQGATRVETTVMDALEFQRHQSVVAMAHASMGGIDVALLAHGQAPDQKACEASFDLTRHEFEVNGLSIISLLTHLANYCENAGHGKIVVISSVAGDRGRSSNYVYGSAKGALDRFLQGLRNRLHRRGVKVITIKPGFVDTPIAAHYPKNWLWAKPTTAGRAIHRAIKRGREVAYVPWFWQIIMSVIRALPEFIFKRLSL